MSTQSTVVAESGMTVLEVAEEVLADSRRPLGPSEIAERGIEMGLFRVPRFRTRGYLTQIVQSTLHDNAEYSSWPSVRRKAKGKYTIRY